jgi:phospholipid/cholesterol/gamma-HCH transport system ATP-binding protein
MIEIKNLKKSFDTKHVTRDLSLEVKQGEFVAIIGRSGEGKSVLLKQIVGLIKPDSGSISLDGIRVDNLKEGDLKHVFEICGYVFQFAALLDSLNVFENVGLARLEEGEDQESVKKIVSEKLESVGLAADTLEKYPSELSGGMRKRVGLARTLMTSPKIILYDEPTTGLDPISTRLIHELILQTHKKINTTSVVISHDVGIFEYADQVAMLFEGKIIYKGPAKDIWDCKDAQVYQFIRGLANGPIQAIP